MIRFYLIDRLWRTSLLVAVFALLGACSILPKAPNLQSYALPSYSVKSDQNSYKRPVNWSLRIGQPNTSQFLNGPRMVVQPEGSEVAVYAGARWGDKVPVLFRDRLIQEFRLDGSIRAVSSDNDGLQADYILNGDLISFQGVYTSSNTSEVVIRYDAHLIRVSDRRIVASRSFEVKQPILGSAMPKVVEAFGQANDRLARDVLNWTLQQGNR